MLNTEPRRREIGEPTCRINALLQGHSIGPCIGRRMLEFAPHENERWRLTTVCWQRLCFLCRCAIRQRAEECDGKQVGFHGSVGLTETRSKAINLSLFRGDSIEASSSPRLCQSAFLDFLRTSVSIRLHNLWPPSRGNFELKVICLT